MWNKRSIGYNGVCSCGQGQNSSGFKCSRKQGRKIPPYLCLREVPFRFDANTRVCQPCYFRLDAISRAKIRKKEEKDEEKAQAKAKEHENESENENENKNESENESENYQNTNMDCS